MQPSTFDIFEHVTDMAGSGKYKRLLQILENWPIDESKAGRDLGQYLRDFVTKASKRGDLEVDSKYWDRQYLALQRLVNNEHCNKYPRSISSSATGLTAEQCNTALSNEFLEHLKQEEQSVFRKISPFDRNKK